MLIHINAYEAYVVIIHLSLSSPFSIYKEWVLILLSVEQNLLRSIILCLQADKEGAVRFACHRNALSWAGTGRSKVYLTVTESSAKSWKCHVGLSFSLWKVNGFPHSPSPCHLLHSHHCSPSHPSTRIITSYLQWASFTLIWGSLLSTLN